MRKSTTSNRTNSKSYPISTNELRSSETLDSTSTLELPSSLREHFEKTKDFEWAEDFTYSSPMLSSTNPVYSMKRIKIKNPQDCIESNSGSIYEDDIKEETLNQDFQNSSNELGLSEADETYKELLSQSLVGCMEASDIFYRKNIFDNQLERIIEEVSNEAFSSFINRSTIFLNSSMNKAAKKTIGSGEDPSKDNLLSLNQK